MDVLINELSLEGQYSTVNEFLSDGLSAFINVLDEISITNHLLLKKYDFYKTRITKEKILHDILVGNISREYDLIRKFKRKLSMLIEGPYWEDDKKHSDDDSYLFGNGKINGSSLAESCERDRVVVSFLHSKFKILEIPVFRNRDEILLDNLYDEFHFLELRRSREELSFEEYVRLKFADTKLNFSLIDDKFGFALLNTTDEKNAFLSSFDKFIKMSWDGILMDVGFEYKTYKNRNIFKRKYSDKNIHKFRTSQKYRCFGYRENDTFFVIRFESDHKLSDRG
ncbi:MAG: hypothetical protein NUV44_06985 [Candidatus Scalindua sp.]|nr:hypothetical protein [Candidatus Scalindua sp.]